MPKIVDHDERRRELAEATWRVILRDGIGGVSMRDVAAEAGLSTGALRHYFANKEELMSGAARLMVERVAGRFEQRPKAVTPYEGVRMALCEILPLDEERTTEGSVWLAFAAHSLVDPRIATEHEIVFDGIRELCERITGGLFDGGWLAQDLDPDGEAARLHALVDGLCMHGLMKRASNDAILGVLNTHLGKIIREDHAVG